MKMRLAVSMVLAVVAVACGGTQPESQEPRQTSEQGIQQPGGGQCGNTVCGAGTYCCNASCGTCVALGDACLDVVCDVAADDTVSASAKAPEAAFIGESCGGVVCGKGTYCCNPSCGTCAPLGMGCSQQSCN